MESGSGGKTPIFDKEGGFHMFDFYDVDLYDPLDPIAYAIYKVVTKDDEEDVNDSDDW